MSFLTQPSVLDQFKRTHLKGLALGNSEGVLRVTFEAVPEGRFFEAVFERVWAFEFEDEFFGAMADHPSDTILGALSLSSDSQRLRNFKSACQTSFHEHTVDLREYRLRSASEILSVVCQGPCRLEEVAP